MRKEKDSHGFSGLMFESSRLEMMMEGLESIFIGVAIVNPALRLKEEGCWT